MLNEVLDNVAQACGKTAQDHGFREDWELALSLEELAEWTDQEDPTGIDSVEQRAILLAAAKALRNNYVGMKLMLVVSELGEALETLRNTGVDGLMMGEGNFGEETTDAHIRLWDLEDLLGVRSGQETVDKMAKNDLRPPKHGRVL